MNWGFRSVFVSAITCLFLLISCGEDSVFEENLSLENQAWNVDQAASFEFSIDETNEYYDIFVNLRNTDDYLYSNLYLFTTMYFPNDRIAVDTLECTLADSQGKWFGSGFGGVHEHKILLSKNKAFPLSGDYRVEIRHAMREDELRGISDVGFGISVHDQ